MPALTNLKLESFAEALARGLSPLEAAEKAHYASDKKAADRRSASPKVAARVKELKRHLDWGGSRDLGPLIDELGAAVQEARKLDSAAAFVAVRGLIVEAARLKKMLPPPEEPRRVPMTPEEWEAKFRPLINGARPPPV